MSRRVRSASIAVNRIQDLTHKGLPQQMAINTVLGKPGQRTTPLSLRRAVFRDLGLIEPMPKMPRMARKLRKTRNGNGVHEVATRERLQQCMRLTDEVLERSQLKIEGILKSPLLTSNTLCAGINQEINVLKKTEPDYCTLKQRLQDQFDSHEFIFPKPSLAKSVYGLLLTGLKLKKHNIQLSSETFENHTKLLEILCYLDEDEKYRFIFSVIFNPELGNDFISKFVYGLKECIDPDCMDDSEYHLELDEVEVLSGTEGASEFDEEDSGAEADDALLATRNETKKALQRVCENGYSQVMGIRQRLDGIVQSAGLESVNERKLSRLLIYEKRRQEVLSKIVEEQVVILNPQKAKDLLEIAVDDPIASNYATYLINLAHSSTEADVPLEIGNYFLERLEVYSTEASDEIRENGKATPETNWKRMMSLKYYFDCVRGGGLKKAKEILGTNNDPYLICETVQYLLTSKFAGNQGKKVLGNVLKSQIVDGNIRSFTFAYLLLFMRKNRLFKPDESGELLKSENPLCRPANEVFLDICSISGVSPFLKSLENPIDLAINPSLCSDPYLKRPSFVELTKGISLKFLDEAIKQDSDSFLGKNAQAIFEVFNENKGTVNRVQSFRTKSELK